MLVDVGVDVDVCEAVDVAVAVSVIVAVSENTMETSNGDTPSLPEGGPPPLVSDPGSG